MKKILYYTDNNIDSDIQQKCIKQLLKANIPIVSVSWKPMDLGTNIVVGEGHPRSDETIFWQITTGAMECLNDIVYLAEHDVLYHPSHFDFVPKKKGVLYYNTNRYRWRLSDNKKWFWKSSNIAGRSQIAGFGDTICDHFNGIHAKKRTFKSKCPNVDIRHDKNLTKGREPEKFVDEIPCWSEINGYI